MMTELDIRERTQQEDYLRELEHLLVSIEEFENTLRNCEKTPQRNTDVKALQRQMNEIEKFKGVQKAKKMSSISHVTLDTFAMRVIFRIS